MSSFGTLTGHRTTKNNQALLAALPAMCPPLVVCSGDLREPRLLWGTFCNPGVRCVLSKHGPLKRSPCCVHRRSGREQVCQRQSLNVRASRFQGLCSRAMPALRRDEETRCCSLNLWISRECGCVVFFARVPLFVVLRGNKRKTTVLRGPEKNDTIMSGYTDQRLQTKEKGCQVVEANGDQRWLM